MSLIKINKIQGKRVKKKIKNKPKYAGFRVILSEKVRINLIKLFIRLNE